MRTFAAIALMTFASLTAQAEECASNLSELREVVGNSNVSTVWIENKPAKEKRLTLRLSNSGEAIGLDLSVQKGSWASMTGIVCKTGPETFVARVKTMNWGPQAPMMAKVFKLSQLDLHLLYPTVLKVVAKGITFNFNGQ